MGFLPKTMGTRPRLACEVRAEGVVAARTEDSAAMLSAAERVAFTGRESAVGRAEGVAAVRRALDAVSQREREVTLVVPDAAVRVLLVDFDELPAKMAEALPVVRFRLKKLLPFDADDAAVSYQVMAQSRGSTQVLAVAMPRESLAEYEGLVREAGYAPGAVLPSTLAALAGLDESERASLVVNAGRESVTTAIVKGGVLLLHRTVDLGGGEAATAAPAKAASATSVNEAVRPAARPVVVDEAAREASRESTIAAIAARFAAMEGQTPAPPASRVGSAPASGVAAQSGTGSDAVGVPGAGSGVTNAVSEITQAVSVAAAYFEDTLETAPQVILSAGTLGAEALTRMLGDMRAEEMVSGGMLGPGVNGGVPAGWLAGVRGALKS